ncbi:MAG: DegT/DnrJ/EryC1/StrS family aminotransferase [Candidatus Omnitrophica bacterium]|nr:DegT/DnrJ/EryC1/StrS family aminotransferase [Candidatus Omnitrophota bacterium]
MINMFWPYISEKVSDAVVEVLKTRWIGQGPKVEEAERKFKKILNVPFPVTVNSCTSALHLALIMSGVGKDDEVITTPMTCSATNIPILYCGGKAVFADIKKDTMNIDPSSIREKITDRTKAILVVHWAGYPCDMDEILAIARERNISVIEDAAHALGAKYKGRPVGSLGDFTCFSFQAIKQITSGDGGLLTVLNKENYDRAKLLRWYGIDRAFQGDIYWKYQIKEVGYKYHMNDIAAAMLIVQLDDLAKILKRRKEIADKYHEGLKGIDGLRLLSRSKEKESGNWLFTVQARDRKGFTKKLLDNGVESHMVHVRCDIYPIFGGKRLDLPVMNEVEPGYVSIPLHNKLTDEDVDKVIKTIKSGW